MSEPAWREKLKNPQALHELWTQRITLPSYLKRWLNCHSNKHPDLATAEILEAAMLMYYQSLRKPPSSDPTQHGIDFIDHLICGRYVNANEEALCTSVLSQEDQVDSRAVCVSNGVYGYFFRLGGRYAGAAEERFLLWMESEWTTRKRKIEGPVIRIQKGEWPLHPRLIPGHPLGKNLEFDLEGPPVLARHRASC